MKKQILILILLGFTVTSGAQIYLEKTYTSSAGITELALSGYKYYSMDVANNRCQIYNMDHSAWKTINLSVPTGMYLYDIKYVSETLFNTDSKVELAYIYYSYDTALLFYTYYTKVVNENGLELLSIPGCSYLEVKPTGIYGTKMLAYVYDYSIISWTMSTLVYSLPGNLPMSGISMEGLEKMKNPFPNPSSSMVTIPYRLPDGVNTGEIRLINELGGVMKVYKVDRTFNELLVQTADLPRGMYVYQVRTDRGVLASGKLIHD